MSHYILVVIDVINLDSTIKKLGGVREINRSGQQLCAYISLHETINTGWNLLAKYTHPLLFLVLPNTEKEKNPNHLKTKKNNETSRPRPLPSCGGGDISHRCSSRWGGELQSNGAEPLCECNYIINRTDGCLLPEVEATRTMLLWVPKRSKIQSLCRISSCSGHCFPVSCPYP